MPGGRPEGIERSVEVDAGDAVPFLGCHLQERVPTAAGHPGVGEAGVHPAHGFHGFGEGLLHRRFVPDIAFQGDDMAADGLQGLHRRRVLGRVRPPDRDIPARLGNRARHAEADARVAAGNKGDFAGKVEGTVGHCASPAACLRETGRGGPERQGPMG